MNKKESCYFCQNKDSCRIPCFEGVRFPVSSAGFTLIEVCLVLVISGLIATAAIKGMDLVRNAQANKVVTWVRGWEQSMYAFLDRKGRYAGDLDQDGVIEASAVQELKEAGLQNLPDDTILYSSTEFVMHIGSSGGSEPLNALVVTKADPAAFFSGSDLIAVEKADLELDGRLNSRSGMVRGYNQVSLDGNGTVTRLFGAINEYEDGAVALAYYFDRVPMADEPLFEADFGNPTLFGAEFGEFRTTDQWNVAGGTLEGSGNGFVLTNDSFSGDVIIQARMSMEGDKSGLALLYMAEDDGSSSRSYPTSGYGFQIDPGLGNQLVLRKFTGTSESVLEKVDFPAGFDITKDHDVQVEVSGNRHVVSVDGVVYIDYEEDSSSAYTSGQVGVRSWDGDTGSVDDLTVTRN